MARINYNNGYYEGEVNYNGEEHGFGTFVWDNGDKYEGQFAYRKFNGQGTYYYANGDKYVGQWSNDLKHGRGTLYYKDGYYEGDWANDVKNGFGRETYSWGYYEGQYKDGKWYGRGKEVHNNGVTFEGIYDGFDTATDVTRTENGTKRHGKIENKKFIADALNGYAKEVYDNGYYEGYFKDGLRHGKGTYHWNSGSIYEGDWEKDLKSGYGKMSFTWGTYEGLWKDDHRYGSGIETNKNGEVYEAFWFDGDTAENVFYTYGGVTKRGKITNGKFVEDASGNFKREDYNNGYYEGEIANGKRNGFGAYHWNSGSRYEGNWVDDIRTGFGKFFWSDGGRYEGQWANNKMNGYGTYYAPSGSVYNGQWKDDEKLYGKQEYSWGYYEGQWANKTWCGQGKEVIYSGATYEGFWQDSKNATNVVCTSSNGTVTYGKIVDGSFQPN